MRLCGCSSDRNSLPRSAQRARTVGVVTGENGPWTVLEEPSWEDFDAAEEEEPKARARAVLVRILRIVGVLLVIVALLLYFIAPFNNIFGSAPIRWFRPDTGTRPIPLAPAPKTSPKLPA